MRKLLLVTSALLSCHPAPKPAAQARTTALAAKTASPPAASSAPSIVKRVVISLSRPSGTSVMTTAPDGTIAIALDVLQNGRGPHVDATLRLAPDGTIASLAAKGHHEMGTPIDESFAREGNRARWKSTEEQGEKELSGAAFYLPMAELPEAIGLLALALLKNGGSLPLLPAGEAHLEKMGHAGPPCSGEGAGRLLTAYAVSGLDLSPVYVWLDDNAAPAAAGAGGAAGPSWFGTVSSWQSVVPEGCERAIEDLLAMQRKWQRDRDIGVYRAIAHKPPVAGIAFTHARVLDVERGKYLPDHTVVVVGDKIASVGPSKRAKIPAGAQVVDLAGKAILPGLWDMHAHLGDADGALDIASGVTTARDVGNDPDKLDDLKQRYDDGSAVGPHVVRFGFIEGRGEKAAAAKVTAETPDEAKAAVELYKQRGYDGIKIYNSMKPELVPLIAKEAHARGMLVTGHIPVHMLANEAVKAGYDGIEHINMLFLNFFADHETDTRTTQRFTLVGDKAAGFDLNGQPARDFFALLKEHHTVVDPTLDAFEMLLVYEPGKITPGLESMAARLPPQAARGALLGGVPLGEKKELYRASFEKLLAMVKALHEDGVPVVVGTDMLAGLMLHHELSLYVRAGIAPSDALRMATIDAARAMKRDKVTGSIAEGKAADLYIVDGDPLARIDDLGSAVTTVKGGVVFDDARLYQTVGVRPR